MKRILTIVTVLVLALTATDVVSAQDSHFYRKGYSGNAGLGVMVKEYPYGALSTTHGYNFGNGWFIGGGLSFQSGLYPRMCEPAINPDGSEVLCAGSNEQYEGGFLLGAHFDARYAFLNRRFTPFVDMKAGLTYDLALEAPGGFVLPSVGVAYGRFSLSAGLNIHLGQTQSGCCISPKVKFMPHIGVAVHF